MATNIDLVQLLKNTTEIFKEVGSYDEKFERVVEMHLSKLDVLVEAGVKSSDFIELVCKVVSYVEYLIGVKVKAYEDYAGIRSFIMYQKNCNTTGFLLMLSKLLPTMGCPYDILTEGPVKNRLGSKKARVLLLHFLASKTRSLKQREREREDIVLDTTNPRQDGTEKAERYSINFISTYIVHNIYHLLINAFSDYAPLDMTDTASGERKSKKGLKKMSDEEKVRRSQDAVGGEDASHISEAGSVEVNVDGETEMRERKICWNCHDTENLLKCGGCQKAWYCDKECQRADRARHGRFCKKQQRRRRMEEAAANRDEVD